MQSKGTLYLIPCSLGESGQQVLPEYIKPIVDTLSHFIVEHEKSARRFLKGIGYSHSLDSVVLYPLNKHTEAEAPMDYLMQLLNGISMGIISEAGMPGVADPGAAVVELAHQNRIKVVPLVGPSSLLLALAASGMNGQGFTFNGYLPLKNPDRKNALLQLERQSAKTHFSQLFIETPFRNNQLLDDILQCCHHDTRLCVACDLTLPTEFVATRTIAQWKKEKRDFNKHPAVFILHAGR
ncbi:MAG: SAM-dependent methyltransferase [Chitinophagales bacterium]|nr:SAM-dependent methyltransferase [Chitinophagales bacterium]